MNQRLAITLEMPQLVLLATTGLLLLGLGFVGGLSLDDPWVVDSRAARSLPDHELAMSVVLRDIDEGGAWGSMDLVLHLPGAGATGEGTAARKLNWSSPRDVLYFVVKCYVRAFSTVI